ncbi:hypothetical protein [Actinobaculum sp. 352]|uniref:hypothetical protein n=2 Tax=unclassified Actinobaculum TaxID=2609299 RepID=UPI0019D1F8C6|nr:hypothetical protein [Actinobaculum sp. 352]
MYENRGVNYFVTRPNEHGDGGGTLSSEDHRNFIRGEYNEDPANFWSDPDQFGRAFDEVRATIDSILEPWTDLPSLDGFDVQLEYCRKLMGMLASSGSTSKGNLVPGGLITDDIDAIERKIENMSGGAIGAFKQKFVDKLGSTVGNLHAVATILGAAMASEREVISQTRTAVADNVAYATETFDMIAQCQTAQDNITLKIAAGAAKAAALFLSGGVATAAELSAIGLATVSEIPEKEYKLPEGVRTYEEGITWVKSLFTSINNDVLRGEQAIATSLTKNMEQMHTDHGNYDLTMPPISTVDGINIEKEAVVDVGLINEIITTNMPTMADNLRDASSKAFLIIMSSVAIRDPNVGLGLAGPNHEFDDLSYTLRQLLSDLAAEVQLGKINLEKVMNLILETDNASSDSLKEVVDQIENRTFDPWDTSRSKLFPPRPGQDEAL